MPSADCWRWSPDTADLRQPDGTWKMAPVGDVPIGATVRVRPASASRWTPSSPKAAPAMDQAPVTGESMPVDKGPAMRSSPAPSTRPARSSAASPPRRRNRRWPASSTRSSRPRAACAHAALRRPVRGRLHAGGVRAGAGRGHRRSLAVRLDGAGCGLQGAGAAGHRLPCALVISTPVTVVSGLASAAGGGILIKGGVHLEQARLIKAIALDKTGTITEGQAALVEWEMLTTSLPRRTAEHIAAALAAHSDHPVSKAHRRRADCRTASRRRNFCRLSGRGIEADIGGQRYVLGNHRLIEERGPVLRRDRGRAAHRHEKRAARSACWPRRPGAGALRGGRHDQALVGRRHRRAEGDGHHAGDADR